MRFFKHILWVIVVLALAACGGAAAPGDGGNGGGDVALSQTLTGADMLGGSVSINYPDGWFVQDELAGSGSAVFANNESLLAMTGEAEIPAGQAGAVISVLPADAATSILGGAEFSLEAFATTFGSMMSGEGLTMGDYEEVTVSGQTIGRIVGQADGSNGAVIMVRALESGEIVMLNGVAASSEVNNYVATFGAMIASVSYTPAG